MSQRIIKCVKLGKELPGLSSPPFEGELGQEIFEKVSAEAYELWQGDMMIKIINEYRLNLVDPEHYNVLLEQMRAFLNLDAKTGSTADVLEVGSKERGRS